MSKPCTSAPAVRRSRRRVPAILLATAAAVTVLAGCGSSAASTGAASGSSAMASAAGTASSSSSGVVIHISQFAYGTPASVSPGATVTVMNMDGERHTVTADHGSAFDTTVDAGASRTFTAPTTPGSYPFHCMFHSNMHGTLVVR